MSSTDIIIRREGWMIGGGGSDVEGFGGLK